LHISFVCTGFWTNSKHPVGDLQLAKKPVWLVQEKMPFTFADPRPRSRRPGSLVATFARSWPRSKGSHSRGPYRVCGPWFLLATFVRPTFVGCLRVHEEEIMGDSKSHTFGVFGFLLILSRIGWFKVPRVRQFWGYAVELFGFLCLRWIVVRSCSPSPYMSLKLLFVSCCWLWLFRAPNCIPFWNISSRHWLGHLDRVNSGNSGVGPTIYVWL